MFRHNPTDGSFAPPNYVKQSEALLYVAKLRKRTEGPLYVAELRSPCARAARARARKNPFFSIMVNVGQMMVWVIGANLQFEIFRFLAAADVGGGPLPLLGQNSNFPWNPQFLADLGQIGLFSTQNEKLGRMELVP